MRFFAVALYLALMMPANAEGLDQVVLEGDMRKLSLAGTPEDLPEIVMETPEGEEVRLSDYAGTPVILNFWATWCAPCREEMPALDAVQAERSGAIEVVTLATGRNPVTGIERFFEEEGIEDLPILLDKNSAIARSMAVLGLPVTVLIDAEGREVGRLTGGADWASPEAAAVIDALIGGGA